jgi:hypothetical protein
MSWAVAAAPPTTDNANIHALQQQADRLDRQLARLKSAPNLAGQQQAMQAHWSMMQEQLRFLRRFPGMAARDCSDWMMMDPSIMGRGWVDPNGGNCPLLGHGPGTLDPDVGKIGVRTGALAWALPSATSASDYQRRMQQHSLTMRARMTAIAAEQDPGRRQALIRAHYYAMYRDMQTMRGMGWMWDSKPAAALPEAGSAGAQGLSRFCTQCHAAPLPSLHTREEWAGTFVRMREHMAEKHAAGAGVLAPTAADINTLFKYLSKHAGTAPAPGR